MTPPEITRNPNPVVRSRDERPARKDGTCFCCQQPIGAAHADRCVLLNRMVKVRYTFELEIEIPHAWDKGHIEFHRNDGSWCASNALDDLKRFEEHSEVSERGCLCSYFKCDVIDVPEAEPYLDTKFKKWEDVNHEHG